MPLSDLITALAAATGPSRELDVMLAGLVFYRQPQPIEAPVMCENAMQTIGASPGTDEPWSANDIAIALEHQTIVTVPAYTGSLDAITGACEGRWPGVKWSVDSRGWATLEIALHFVGLTETRCPALALCLAAARLAEREAGDGAV